MGVQPRRVVVTELAIDTATTDLVVGVVGRAERVIATRSHNELLVPAVEELLAETGLSYSDITRVTVGCGPGPFTGLRVGMATASAFAQALGVPIRGVCTHDAVAQLIDGDDVLVVTDARRREVYWARYHKGTRIDGPNVTAPGKLPAEVGVLSVPEHLDVPVKAGTVLYQAPLPAGLAAAPEIPLEPLYLRRPDAQVPKVMR